MKTINTTHRVLLLPGWQNSGPSHWQSLWEARFGFARVEQSDWHWPRRGDWQVQLEEAVLADERPVVLVAHSLGCHLAAAWAGHSRHAGRVAAALLVAPPDLTRDDLPAPLQGWRAPASAPLPFPSLVAFSDDDPFAGPDVAMRLAQGWQSRLHAVGAAGHINGDSGLGDWPEGQLLLRNLLGEIPRRQS